MSDFMTAIYGDYTRQFMTAIIPFATFALTTALFALPLKKRTVLPVRLVCGLLFYWAVFSGIAVLRTRFDSYAMRIVIRIGNYFLMLPYLFVFLRETPFRVLLCWCGGVASEEVSAHFFSLLLGAFGRDDRETISFFPELVLGRDLAIHYAIVIACCVLLYLLFGRRDAAEQDKKSVRSITVMSFVSTVSLALMSSLLREYQAESGHLYQLCLAALLSYAVVILFMRSGILAQSKYRAELNVMEEVLTQERKQYEMIRDNIDFINMKCHDIKHQLANLEGRLTDDEILSLQQAIEIYDSTIKTGNETLDTVLYEKSLLCREKKIRLSCLCDGAALRFMGRTHLYSLFNNALGNAVEAADKVTDPEKRAISLTVEKENGIVLIDLSNYFADAPVLENGTLQTSKADKAHHGLGVRSMRYVTDLYGGTIDFEVDDDMFHLSVTFPENAERKEAAV